MIVRFDDFCIDTQARVLLRAGRPVALQPKAFDLLMLLIENRERVVSRNDLFAAIWQGEIVSDAALSFSIKAIRQALGDSGRPRRYIETAHSRGFRFIAACNEDRNGDGARRSPVPADADPQALGHGAPRLGTSNRPTPFVGRVAELAALSAYRREALAGHGRICLLAGDPGSGKSRLAAEALAEAAGAGFVVCYGRCHDAAAPSLWPWVQVVNACLASLPPAEAVRLLGASATDLARLSPAVHELVPDLPRLPSVDPEQARLRLFDSIIEFLARTSREQPLAICLEDLHWADASSILLLRQATAHFGRRAVLLIGTFRPEEIAETHALAQALATLRRERQVEFLEMTGLRDEHGARLLRSICDAMPTSVVDRLVQRAAGHPYYLEELGRDYAERGDSDESLPDGVRATIAGRLARLPDDCRQVLALAAVVGRDFDYELLWRASGRSAEDVVDALECAAAARIVAEVSPGVLRFAHALTRESLYQDLSGLRRADLHRRVADALVERLGSGSAAIAHHFARAVAVIGWQTAYERLVAAGEDAVTRLAFEEAVAAFEHALELRPADEPPPPAEHGRLLLALGRARRHAGESPSARAAFEEAITLARAHGLDELLAEGALALRSTWALHDDVSAEVVADALERIAPGDSPLRARLLSQLGVALYLNRSESRRRRELLSEAAAMARRLDEPRTLFDVLNDCHWAMWSPDTLQERLALATEQLAVAQLLGDVERRLTATMWRLVDLLEAGCLRDFDAEIGAFARLAEQHRWPRFRWNALCFRAMRAYLDGRLEEASELAGRALDVGQLVEPRTALLTYWGAHLWHVRAAEGRLHEFAEQIVQVGQSLAGIVDPAWIPIVQLGVAIEQGSQDVARGILAQIARDGFAALPAADSINARVQALALMAQAVAALDAKEHAPTLYDMLRPYEEQWVVIAFGAMCFGSVALPLGGLATTARRWRAAETHLERARRIHAEEGARLPGLWTQFAWARMLLASGKKAGRGEAIALLDSVSKEARAIGHSLLQAEVANLRRRQ